MYSSPKLIQDFTEYFIPEMKGQKNKRLGGRHGLHQRRGRSGRRRSDGVGGKGGDRDGGDVVLCRWDPPVARPLTEYEA